MVCQVLPRGEEQFGSGAATDGNVITIFGSIILALKYLPFLNRRRLELRMHIASAKK